MQSAFIRRIVIAAMLVVASASLGSRAWADAPATRPAGAMKVACIGDSITFGSGSKDRQTQSYPSQLQTLLDAKQAGAWEVQNFGVSGATLLKKGDRPYWDQKRFAAAKAFAPDVVVIKLGTNDSKPQNWEFKDQFKADLIAMVEAFGALPSKPAIWVCRPVPAFPGAYGIRDEIIRGEILPIIDSVAKEKGVKVIDLYTALSGHRECFPDTIHPNAEGARLMAVEVSKALVASATTAPAGARP